MKGTLVFAPPSKQYDLPWSTEKLNDPLQSYGFQIFSSLRMRIPSGSYQYQRP